MVVPVQMGTEGKKAVKKWCTPIGKARRMGGEDWPCHCQPTIQTHAMAVLKPEKKA